MFEEYDKEKVKEARDTLLKVLEYYYYVPGSKREVKRLDTIVIKLNELIAILDK